LLLIVVAAGYRQNTLPQNALRTDSAAVFMKNCPSTQAR
jgi:hypothetical protein